MDDIILELQNIKKSFDDKEILNNFNLKVNRNEFVTFLGASGCGKTTILRIIAGFEKTDSGKVLFDNKDITKLPPNLRNINTVFQKYSLFPHLNVSENIAFGLKIKKKSKDYIKDKIKYALKLVNMEGYENRHPDSLSGGQQQRIAIARAIVNEPKILLLDEPLSALDLKLRHEMQQELIRIKKEVGITFIYVTHDQEEALTMSDRVVVMNQGIIQQIGTPLNVYDEPKNAFVADFIGDSNILDGIMIEDKLVEIHNKKVPCVDYGFKPNEPVDVVIRPEDLKIVDKNDGYFSGRVISVIYKGAYFDIKVQSTDFTWTIQSNRAATVGNIVGLSVIPDDIQVMHKPTSSDEKIIT